MPPVGCLPARYFRVGNDTDVDQLKDRSTYAQLSNSQEMAFGWVLV